MDFVIVKLSQDIQSLPITMLETSVCWYAPSRLGYNSLGCCLWGRDCPPLGMKIVLLTMVMAQPGCRSVAGLMHILNKIHSQRHRGSMSSQTMRPTSSATLFYPPSAIPFATTTGSTPRLYMVSLCHVKVILDSMFGKINKIKHELRNEPDHQ